MTKEVWSKETHLDEETVVESTVAITYDRRDRVVVSREKMTRILAEAGYLPRKAEDVQRT